MTAAEIPKQRPLWWPKCPFANAKPGTPGSLKRYGWDQAEFEIFRAMEQSLHEAATRKDETE